MIVVVAIIAALLQQPRDTPAVAHGRGIVAGVVVSDDLETRPVRHARVMLNGSGVSGQTAITDERGRFVFTDLPAGRYSVSATKTAWITTSYGGKRPGRPGSTIPVADRQTVEIVMRMPHGAVLSGVVLGYEGEPASRVSVQAMHYATVEGVRRLVPSGNGTVTDDRGAYRLYGLQAGDYTVQAAVPAGGRGPVKELYLTTDVDVRYAASGIRTPPPSPSIVTFAPTYFPSATDPSQAAMVTIRAGEERDDIDVQLQLEPAGRVEGVVAPLGTGVPPGTEVLLVNTGDRRIVASDGAFAFPNLAPGVYTLVARAAAPQFMWTSMEVAMSGEPVTGIVLSLQPGMRVSGRVQFASTGRLTPPDMSAVRVALQPVLAPGLVGFAPVPVSPAADGSFTVNGVTPGRYRLTASLPGTEAGARSDAGGWHLRSAVIGGRDTLDVPITIQPNQDIADTAITFVDRAGSLTGRILDATGNALPGSTVVLFPADPALWIPQARRIRAVRSSVDGVFTIPTLPAGEYIVSAVDDPEPGEWFDPAFLQRLLPGGTKIDLGEGEQKTLDVRAADTRSGGG